ncbi:MAG: HAD family hydrolase [Euzebya sp.]
MLAAFFDLDGCLVDSRAAISGAINHALTTLGVRERPPEQLYGFIGPPLVHTFEALLASEGQDPARAPQAIEAYREEYRDGALRLTTVVPGVESALAGLSGHLAVRVVTSKPVEQARAIVQALGLDRWVEEVHGPDLSALTEPKSVKLEAALAQVGCAQPHDRPQTAMIGDRLHDVQAGQACGTATVGVTWGIGDCAELTGAGADHVIDRPDQLAAILLD